MGRFTCLLSPPYGCRTATGPAASRFLDPAALTRPIMANSQCLGGELLYVRCLVSEPVHKGRFLGSRWTVSYSWQSCSYTYPASISETTMAQESYWVSSTLNVKQVTFEDCQSLSPRRDSIRGAHAMSEGSSWSSSQRGLLLWSVRELALSSASG